MGWVCGQTSRLVMTVCGKKCSDGSSEKEGGMLTLVHISVSLAAMTDSSCCASASSTSATLDITFQINWQLGLGYHCAHLAARGETSAS
jgi:hypothetical protein